MWPRSHGYRAPKDVLLHDVDVFSRLDTSESLRDGIRQVFSSFALERMAAPSHEAATKAELHALRQTVEALQARLRCLEQHAEREIVIREIPEEQARTELVAFFRDHPGTYPSDAAVALGLDPALARDIAAGVVKDGLLEG
jgi:hypothetical protein